MTFIKPLKRQHVEVVGELVVKLLIDISVHKSILVINKG